jgi:hypothetical protein
MMPTAAAPWMMRAWRSSRNRLCANAVPHGAAGEDGEKGDAGDRQRDAERQQCQHKVPQAKPSTW